MSRTVADSLDIPANAKARVITDHNGNPCGVLWGVQELPWPLIEMIDQDVPTTGYHGVNYHTRSLDE